MDVFSRFIFLHNPGLYIFLDFIFYIKLTTNLIIRMVWAPIVVLFEMVTANLLALLLPIYFRNTREFGKYYDICYDILDSFYVS